MSWQASLHLATVAMNLATVALVLRRRYWQRRLAEAEAERRQLDAGQLVLHGDRAARRRQWRSLWRTSAGH